MRRLRKKAEVICCSDIQYIIFANTEMGWFNPKLNQKSNVLASTAEYFFKKCNAYEL